VFKSTKKTTKREAKQVEAMERHKIMNEVKLTPQEKTAKMMLSEAINKVYDVRWKHNKDASGSLERAELILKIMGDIAIGSIGEGEVNGLIGHLEKKQRSAGTINRYLAALKTILKHFKQSWDDIKLRKENKGRIRVLSPKEEAEVLKLLRNAPNGNRRVYYPDVADLVEVLLDTGCRVSEILNLRFDDVNFETNLISIWVNKGDRPRSIPMTSRVGRILSNRKATNPIMPFSINVFQADKVWIWVRKSLGLQDDKEFVIHALRHTCASRLVNRGIDLYVVKEWLGHSSIQVTEKYAHLAPHKLANAVKVLER
jgi:integrase